jgi:hypothetical protein
MTNQKTILLTALIEQLKDDIAPEMKIDDYVSYSKDVEGL